MQSKAATVDEYLASLPEDRRAAITAVRDVIRANLDEDIEEGMSYGMIGYGVPHRVYPAGYHCDPTKPLPYAALASQKQYMSLYLMANYCEDEGEDANWFQTQWAKTGKKLDMGKSCIRFKKLDDLALDVIGAAIKRLTARRFIEFYERGLASAGKPAKTAAEPAAKRPAAKKASAAKPATKKPAARAARA